MNIISENHINDNIVHFLHLSVDFRCKFFDEFAMVLLKCDVAIQWEPTLLVHCLY
jgi:hypothetical protein